VVHFHAAAPGRNSAGKQCSLSVPTADELVIYKTCLAIAEELKRQGRLPYAFQVLWVAVSGLQRREAMPVPLFERERRRERLAGVMDVVNQEFGDLTLYPASLHPAKAQVMWNAANRGMYRELEIAG